ncbi:nucleotidyltransferase domain-containing protein [Candidatus Peregrinibacteria bacterium]|jgi:predicted nucleotidyltransferase|nr:nucleotidyltransferase domain-containing protein [Candidatus Peregrinibacteria bacterium]
MPIKKLPQEIIQCFKNSKVEFVYLFGSQIRGDNKEESDFDFAIYFSEVLNKKQRFLEESKLQSDLEKVLSKNGNLAHVDIINISNTYNEFLIYDIVTQGKIIYEKNIDFRITTMLPYIMKSKDFMERRHGNIIRKVQKYGENHIFAGKNRTYS